MKILHFDQWLIEKIINVYVKKHTRIDHIKPNVATISTKIDGKMCLAFGRKNDTLYCVTKHHIPKLLEDETKFDIDKDFYIQNNAKHVDEAINDIKQIIQVVDQIAQDSVGRRDWQIVGDYLNNQDHFDYTRQNTNTRLNTNNVLVTPNVLTYSFPCHFRVAVHSHSFQKYLSYRVFDKESTLGLYFLEPFDVDISYCVNKIFDKLEYYGDSLPDISVIQEGYKIFGNKLLNGFANDNAVDVFLQEKEKISSKYKRIETIIQHTDRLFKCYQFLYLYKDVHREYQDLVTFVSKLMAQIHHHSNFPFEVESLIGNEKDIVDHEGYVVRFDDEQFKLVNRSVFTLCNNKHHS